MNTKHNVDRKWAKLHGMELPKAVLYKDGFYCIECVPVRTNFPAKTYADTLVQSVESYMDFYEPQTCDKCGEEHEVTVKKAAWRFTFTRRALKLLKSWYAEG